MFEKKCVPLKLIIALLIVMLLLGQTCVGSFGESSIYDGLNIKIEKTVQSMSGSDPNKYYLGQLIKATYKITSDPITIDVPKEIVFVIDLTKSMSSTTTGTETRIEALKKVLAPFLELWRGQNTKICVLGFSSDVFIDTGLIEGSDENIQKLVNDVNSWSTSTLKPGTNLGEAIKRANYILKDSTTPNARKYIISLTDGMPDKYTIDNDSYNKDKNSKNFYYKKDKIGTKISTTNSIISAPSGDSMDQAKGIDYAKGVMAKFVDPSIRNFLIGFGIREGIISGTDQVGNMNSIGIAGGLKPIKPGSTDYFYRPANSGELQGVFDVIAASIADEIVLYTADITETLNDDVSLPNDIDPFRDISKGTPGAPGVLKGNIIETDSSITLPINLKLKNIGGNTFALEPQEFSIYYRIASTDTIRLPSPRGEFAFTDPVEGKLIEKIITGTSKEITVRQTVNSVCIPPKVIFTDEMVNTNITATINPTSGLADGDNKILFGPVFDGSGIFKNYGSFGNTAFKFELSGKVGTANITATSSGYAFGGVNQVIGAGKVMVVKPTIKDIDVELGKTASTELSLETPVDYDLFLDDLRVYAMKQSFKGYVYKISPLHKKPDFWLGGTRISDMIFQSDSFDDEYGSWRILSFNQAGKRGFLIINRESGKLLSTNYAGNIYQWGVADPNKDNIDFQLWSIDEMEDGNFKVTSRLTNKSLQIRKNRSSDLSGIAGTEAITGVYTGDKHQKWDITVLGPDGAPAAPYSIKDNIEFDQVSGAPAVEIPDAQKGSIKIVFGEKEEVQNDGSTKLVDDYTKLVIRGVNATVLNKGKSNEKRYIPLPIKVTATVKYKNADYTESKAKVAFNVDVFTEIDVN